jgi:hypothetical protein
LLSEKIPSNNALKYKPVPPHKMGIFFLSIILYIFLSTSFAYSPADIGSFKFLTPIR